MRFVIVTVLSLILFSVGFFFPSQSHELEKTTQQSHADSRIYSGMHDASEPITTKKLFTAFRSPIEKIAPKATRIEILAIAKFLFGTHPLVDEWVSLCFRLRRDGKGSISELKRFAELQIQMLSDLDAKKHAQEIEAYQVALEELDQVSQIYKQAQGIILPLRSPEELTAAAHGWDSEALKHLVRFNSFKKTNPEAARIELSKIAKIRFGTHALTDEWIALYFRLSREEKGLISDVKHVSELEIQMFTDASAEKHAEPIQQHRKALKQYDELVKTLKEQGKKPETVKVDFKSPLDLK